jgi:hypothetical protein
VFHCLCNLLSTVSFIVSVYLSRPVWNWPIWVGRELTHPAANNDQCEFVPGAVEYGPENTPARFFSRSR